MRLFKLLPVIKKLLPREGISQRLFWFSLLAIAILSITAGAFKYYSAYQDAWLSLNQTLTAIKHSQVPGISYHVCNRQTEHLLRQAHAIHQLPHIIQVTITEGKLELARAGDADGYSSVLTRQYPIICFSSDQKAVTAMLTVTANADHIAGHAVAAFLFALGKNAAILILLAGAILIYLNGTFVRPLGKIKRFIDDLDPGNI